MVLAALRIGLRGWARAPIRAAFDFAVVVAIVVAAWALVIEVSPNGLVTLAVCGMVANLGLAGWGRYCAALVAGEPVKFGLVASGFTRPISVTIAGMMMVTVIGLPAWACHAALSLMLAPDWLITLATVVVACAMAPLVITSSIDMAAGASMGAALCDGFSHAWRARRAWPSQASLCLIALGLAVTGVLPGVLLEQHALATIGHMMPTQFAEFGLAAARAAAFVGGTASIAMASCVLVATDS
jgi:hypothetical protein